MSLKQHIIKALGTVADPDLKQDIVTLGMIQELQIVQEHVQFTLVLTTPACPLQETIKQACITAIHTQVAPHLSISIQLKAQVTSSKTPESILPAVKNIIAIASGKGGVGKSTLATNLAVALAQQGAQVGLLDADIFGPSIPILWGCMHTKLPITQQEGQHQLIPLEKYGVKLISIGLLAPIDQAMVWRGPMASTALKQLLGDAAWGKLDYLFIDLPPGTSDIHLTVVQTVPVTGAVIITTPQKVALLDAAKGLALFSKPQVNVPILGIVENMAYFSPELPASPTYYIFGKGGGQALAAQHGVPFLGHIPLMQLIQESGDNGVPVVLKPGKAAQILGQIAQKLAQQIAIRNAQQPPSQRVTAR